MADRFSNVPATLIAPAVRSQFVNGGVLAADLELDDVSRSLRCDAAGTLVCRLLDDDDDITLNLAAREQVDLRVEVVRTTSTAQVHFFS